MKTVVPGFVYELASHKPNGVAQILAFVHKAAKAVGDDALEELDDGTTTEEVIMVLMDRLTFLNAKLPSANTQSIFNLPAASMNCMPALRRPRKTRRRRHGQTLSKDGAQMARHAAKRHGIGARSPRSVIGKFSEVATMPPPFLLPHSSLKRSQHSSSYVLDRSTSFWGAQCSKRSLWSRASFA